MTLLRDPAFWLLALFLIPLLLRVPIAISLGFSALVVAWKWDLGVAMISYNFFAGIAKFPLLAIPFFIVAGFIMERAGIAARLVALMEALSDGDRRAVEDAVATHPDPPNRGGPPPPFPFPSRTLPAILRADGMEPTKTRRRVICRRQCCVTASSGCSFSPERKSGYMCM